LQPILPSASQCPLPSISVPTLLLSFNPTNTTKENHRQKMSNEVLSDQEALPPSPDPPSRSSSHDSHFFQSSSHSMHDERFARMERLSSGEFSASDSELSDSEQVAVKASRDPRMEVYDDMSDLQTTCLNFAMEHRIFLKAILGLLAERDKKATEIGMNDPNTLKSGPLKKASHLVSGVWKVKFVELRRGMFSYYEDTVSGDKSTGGLLRKNIPLDANTCTCRPVKIHRNGLNMAPGGAIFELKIENTRRLWLAKSKAERLAWVNAINDAMVGGSLTQGKAKEQHGKSGTVFRRSPYQKDLKQYLKTKTALTKANSKIEYMAALFALVGSPLEVPVQWLMEQMQVPSDGGGAFQETEVSKSIEQLWKDLLRDTLQINGELFHGDSGHGPEKIIGALSRNIVAFSHSANASAKYKIPESRAIGYARDILLSVNRTRSGGDAYFCIDTLCKNSDLIVAVPSSREAEPMSISVEVDESDDPTDYSVNDKSGWVRTRNRLQKSWRKRFFVLSEGILSLYRNATPRPHGLRGQTVVTGATISVDKSKEYQGNYTIYIETKDGLKDRWLYFTNKYKLLQWAFALELSSRGTSVVQKSMGRLGLRAPKDALTTDSSTSDDQDIIEESMRAHAIQIGIAGEEFEARAAHFSAKNSSRVKVHVKAATEYNISTTDPQGDETDTWATLSATFMQTFRISGDRIVRGEELVRVEVTTCQESVPDLRAPGEEITSPSSARKKLIRRSS